MGRGDRLAALVYGDSDLNPDNASLGAMSQFSTGLSVSDTVAADPVAVEAAPPRFPYRESNEFCLAVPGQLNEIQIDSDGDSALGDTSSP
jgi:hypothetical protein